ncbi:MAG: DUF1674 domain-containing protein [Gammaproteobacteria bacterium]
MNAKSSSCASKEKNDRSAVENQVERGDLQDSKPREIGGPHGPEPTRYGDWERKGRCIDF